MYLVHVCSIYKKCTVRHSFCVWKEQVVSKQCSEFQTILISFRVYVHDIQRGHNKDASRAQFHSKKHVRKTSFQCVVYARFLKGYLVYNFRISDCSENDSKLCRIRIRQITRRMYSESKIKRQMNGHFEGELFTERT